MRVYSGQQGWNKENAQQEQAWDNGVRNNFLTRSIEMSQEKDGFQSALAMGMSSLKGVRMDYNHPVQHVRVRKQRDSSPIENEQQRKKKSEYVSQRFVGNHIVGYLVGKGKE